MIKSTLKRITRTAVFIAIVSALSLLAPMGHKAFMRHYVGSKVVMLANANPETAKQYGGGTGFHVTAPSGKVYIVTNRHVCTAAVKGMMFAAVRGKTPYIKIKVIERSDFSDLCLMEALPGIKGLVVTDEPSIGQSVAVIGHPNLQPSTLTMGEVVGYDQQTMAIGVVGRDNFTAQDCKNKDTKIMQIPDFFEDVSKKYRDTYGYDIFNSLPWSQQNYAVPNTKPAMIQVCVARNLALVTTAMGYQGSSGSPMVDFFGRIVGVVYSIAGDRIWARAITVSDLQKFLAAR